MKKTFIIGFILLGIVAKGDMGTDIKQNEIILNNIKTQNSKLREEVKRLSQILDQLEINLSKEVKFEDLGIEMIRKIDSFTIKILSANLSQGEYNKVLNNFIEVIEYNSEDPIIFEGNKENTNFLNEYFTAHGFDPNRITLKITEDDNLISDGKEMKIVETKIILKRKEN